MMHCCPQQKWALDDKHNYIAHLMIMCYENAWHGGTSATSVGPIIEDVFFSEDAWYCTNG